MKKRIGVREWVPVAVACAALMVVSSCGQSAGPGGSRAAAIVDVIGKVTHNGKPATVRGTLAAGDVVRVPRDGLARIQYPDGTKFVLVGRTEAGAELTFGKESTDAGVRVSLVNLARGILGFLVRNEAKESRYEIEAVSSLTVVRGTQGKVQTGPDGDLIALKVGKVEVIAKATGSSTNLSAGSQIQVSAKGGVGSPVPYDFSTAEERELLEATQLDMKMFERQ
jgi:hypothetical protein